ncbi:MAG: hydratase, partial [Ramlibacter sp.]|nr:hydratase [Ramlibacter sp.]
MSSGAALQLAAPFDAGRVARRLVRAHKGVAVLRHADVPARDSAAAYAVQDETVQGLGAVGGWKVDARTPGTEPRCAPLPAGGLHASGAALVGPQWRMRGVEVELALRLGRDLVCPAGEPDEAMLRGAVESVLPAIEVIETRLCDWRDSPVLAQLADLHNHGGLVLGAPSALGPAGPDLRTVQAYLAFDGQPVA